MYTLGPFAGGRGLARAYPAAAKYPTRAMASTALRSGAAHLGTFALLKNVGLLSPPFPPPP